MHHTTAHYVTTDYAIQCRDVTTGVTGCFMFDLDHWVDTGEFRARSPVFENLLDFYAWRSAYQIPSREFSPPLHR